MLHETVDFLSTHKYLMQGVNLANSEQGKSVTIAAGLMAAGTLSSRVLGLFRDMAMAAFFSRTMTDAWLVAFRIPNLFRRIFGEGALNVSFIPVFVQYRTLSLDPSKPEDARRLADRQAKDLLSAIFTILLSVLTTFTILGIIFAEEIIAFLIPGEAYRAIEGKFDLTVRLARIMFVYINLVCLYAYFMGILNSIGKFGLAAFAPALWNASMLLFMMAPNGTFAEPGDELAWGVVFGGVLQLAILVPALMKKGLLPRLQMHWKVEGVKEVFQGMGPAVLGLGVLQIMVVVNTAFASHLPEGTNSWIFWADRVLELPLSLFAVSLGNALLPTLSSQWAQGQKEAMSETLGYYLRLILVVSIPAFFGMWMLSKPIVEVLFMRGQFSLKDLEGTASVLRIESLSVLSYSMIRVMSPAFYAIRNTRFPAICSAISLAVHVALAPALMDHWGVEGLVSSSVAAGFLTAILLTLGARVQIGGLQYSKIGWTVLKVLVASSFMCSITLAYEPLRLFFGEATELGRILALATTVTLSLVGFALLGWLLRIEELLLTGKILTSRIAKKFARR